MSAADKFKLWFFRDISRGHRQSLYSIFGMPVAEIRTHGDESHIFKHILSTLKPEGEQISGEPAGWRFRLAGNPEGSIWSFRSDARPLFSDPDKWEVEALYTHPAPCEQISGEPVAEVVWYDPRTDMLLYERPQKIIDASIAFIEGAPIGTKLYAHPSPCKQISAAVYRKALQKIADLIDSEADDPLDDAISIANKALASPAPEQISGEAVERVRGEDWENACHELFWEAGNIEQFELIQKLAHANAKERGSKP